MSESIKQQPIKEQMIEIEEMRIRELADEDYENPFDRCEICGEVILSEDLEYMDEMKVHSFCKANEVGCEV